MYICVVYICKKVMDKKLASRQYAANQMGGPLPKLGQKIKGIFKGKGGSRDHPGAVKLACSKTGCNAYAGGGESTGEVRKAKNKKSSAEGEKNEVMKPGSRKLANWQRKLSKVKNVSDRSKF